jgi:hypothetical protein
MYKPEKLLDTAWSGQRETQTSLRLPSCHLWIIAVGTLDILITMIILSLGGFEANPIAAAIIADYGLAGMVVYKYFCIALLIFGCEFVARTRIDTARRLAMLVVAISAAPVVWGLLGLSTLDSLSLS